MKTPAEILKDRIAEEPEVYILLTAGLKGSHVDIVGKDPKRVDLGIICILAQQLEREIQKCLAALDSGPKA